MKFVCCKCLKLISEGKIIRMPFQSLEDEYYCEECYNKWAYGNPYRHPIKKQKKKK